MNLSPTYDDNNSEEGEIDDHDIDYSIVGPISGLMPQISNQSTVASSKGGFRNDIIQRYRYLMCVTPNGCTDHKTLRRWQISVHLLPHQQKTCQER